ncbi:MAG: phosphatidate cytidylyltransferase, partial [Bacilli bacterium]|nr:phosphatidate cytidylyltransferase [Bacilli bacterium]
MEKEDIIARFSYRRPDSLGVYGYGSGVFKQAIQAVQKVPPQTDIIFIVEDIRKWHQENMKLNQHDYSILGKIHFNSSSISKLKGKNNITYLSNIYENDFYFKYGVIEVEDFLRGLSVWDNIFVAGRFHKPVLEIKSNEEIKESINYNRKCALMIACLFCDPVTNITEVYRRISALSYTGDARMAFAENPNKVKNIVSGSFDKFVLTYPLIEDYITSMDNGMLYINHSRILERMDELPESLLTFLTELDTDYSCLDIVRINVGTFFIMKNRQESKNQIVEGIKTNGIVRSVPYAFAKVRKR